MVPDRSDRCRGAEAELATALVLGRSRHRGRRWGSAARTLLSGVTVPSPVPAPRRRVLCSDRRAPLAEYLAAALRLAGFEARGCSDGSVALAEVTDFRPHACVLDLDTPGVGGCELAQWVRSELGGLVYLIGVADHTEDGLDWIAADAGFDLVLGRPLDAGLIVGLLAGHQPRSGHR